MFRKFKAEEHVSSHAQVKSSVQRTITKDIAEQYPKIAPEALEEVLPKKDQLTIVKCADHVNFVLSGDKSEVLFFNQRDGPYYPTLRLLHKLGDVMHTIKVHVGAIKPLIGGAELMCPGIVKDGIDALPANTPVQIVAEGKELPFAIGITKLSGNDIIDINSGVGVDILHILGDGLWVTPTVD